MKMKARTKSNLLGGDNSGIMMDDGLRRSRFDSSDDGWSCSGLCSDQHPSTFRLWIVGN